MPATKLAPPIATYIAAANAQDDAEGDEREPADVGEGDRRHEERRQPIVHRRASGSNRRTSQYTKAISAASVPSMMSTPMSEALL